MKRLIILIVVLLSLIYWAETSSWTGFAQYQPELLVSYREDHYELTWTPLTHIMYYKVEAIPNTASDGSYNIPEIKPIKYRTWKNKFIISNQIPLNTFWRVSAQGLFHRPLGAYSNVVNIAQINKDQLAGDQQHVQPLILSSSTPESPASVYPLLYWTKVPRAVQYELEIFADNPQNPKTMVKLFATKYIYSNGYQANLSGYKITKFYWRVRAIDYFGRQIGNVSSLQELFIDPKQEYILKPYPNTEFNNNGMPTPLYPVYSWIPVAGAVKHEVEVTNQPPENVNDIQPSKFRIWSMIIENASDCYDEHARITPGAYYWRVRGLDANNNPVGVWSDAETFLVDLKRGNYAATFGDSITHGGGGISYSPADWEYNYQTYLQFPVVNLGKSGDTSETMAERFDRDVLPFSPKFLLILGGTNSLRGGIPAERVIQDLTQIRQKCLAYNIRPIFLTLPPINPTAINIAFKEGTSPTWKEEFTKVNQFIRKQQYYIDLEPYFLDSKGELPSSYGIDGLHPDLEAKKLMAQIINSNWRKVAK